jgi:ribonuclease HII
MMDMREIEATLCGIDEAGRGPLAGPLVMAGVVLCEPIEGLDDSKKLTPKRREALFERITNTARYHIVRFDAEEIDARGISACIAEGLRRIRACFGDEVVYLFDGNSSFGVAGIVTMIKADGKVPEVSAASILAKVTRDREMERAALRYPQYGFEKHKGYATKAHYDALLRYGRCAIHRKSFRVKGLDEPTLF